jgi:hypothetical protein
MLVGLLLLQALRAAKDQVQTLRSHAVSASRSVTPESSEEQLLAQLPPPRSGFWPANTAPAVLTADTEAASSSGTSQQQQQQKQQPALPRGPEALRVQAAQLQQQLARKEAQLQEAQAGLQQLQQRVRELEAALADR